MSTTSTAIAATSSAIAATGTVTATTSTVTAPTSTVTAPHTVALAAVNTHGEAAGVISGLNDFVDSKQVITALAVALVTGLVAVLWQILRQRRRITWRVLYDAPINQNGPDLWQIMSGDRRIEDGSLVVVDVRSSGGMDIDPDHFALPLGFSFPGREVVRFKVRDSEVMHRLITQDAAGGSTLHPGDDLSKVNLPALPLNRGTDFKLLFLLSGTGKEVTADGYLRSGRIVQKTVHPRRYQIAALVGVVALLAGAAGGVWLANRALVPTADCANGTLTVAGSTAFAPIATQVKNGYEQSCPNATVNVLANGSEAGLRDLAATREPSRIAMSDGLPKQQPDGVTARAAGVVVFAVVANTSLRATHPEWFSGGMTTAQLGKVFNTPSVYGNIAVGRTAGSGTRATFETTVLGGASARADGAPDARACGPADGNAAKAGACTEPTTMDVLNYVNATPNAIGYAEADALPYFPNVATVPIGDSEPTRHDALNGSYPFVATEYLYTAGQPKGLTRDFIAFLTDDATSAELRGHGYIGCSDLAGTKLGGACAGG